MTENIAQNSCRYNAELISYLYDEIAPADKSRFETHLAGCFVCTAELTEFSFARASIIEWREAEFQPLATPIFKLPAREIISASQNSGAPSLIDSVRRFFAFSPQRAGAALAAAALLIGGGLFFAGINLRNSQETARFDTEAANSIAADLPEVAPKSEIGKPENIVSGFAADSAKENNRSTENAESPVKKNRIGKSIGQTSVDRAPPAPVKSSSAPVVETKVKPVQPTLKKSAQKPSPLLIADEDDDEDDSLRLADIFSEAGS